MTNERQEVRLAAQIRRHRWRGPRMWVHKGSEYLARRAAVGSGS